MLISIRASAMVKSLAPAHVVPPAASSERRKGASLRRRALRNRTFLAGAGLLILLVVPVVVLPPVLGISPIRMSAAVLRPPSVGHLFGTDSFGRDILIRVLYGARISLLIGLATMLITSAGGILIGTLAGFYHKVDNLLMRMMDVLMAFPSLLLALGVMAALGRSPGTVLVALALVYMPRTARVVRSVVLSLKQEQYIEAATALGASGGRLLARHLLPNVVPPLTVQATFVFGYAILAEAGLSFIGLGIQPPTPSLGNILGDARAVLREAPWSVFFPGGWTVGLVMAVNLLGDALREFVDPRMGRL